MKKFFYFLTITTFLSAGIISCKDKVTVESIRLSITDMEFGIGETITLTANLIPYDAKDKWNWTTSDASVVSMEIHSSATANVSKCDITAKAKGTAIITVHTKDSKLTATCTVTVITGEPELILVEGGKFMMGCNDDECMDFELPRHEVTLNSFKIAKYPVTQKQWKLIMGNNPSWYYSIGDNLPVNNVSWNEVQEYIGRLNVATGKNYRLPTEAEWEYAARGGNKSKGYKYSGSDNVYDVAWCGGSNNYQPVGTKEPNELGIYDMSGNVLEWCYDWADFYSNQPQNNPTGPDSGIHRIMRGGSVGIYAIYCRVATRLTGSPEAKYQNSGVRLVLP